MKVLGLVINPKLNLSITYIKLGSPEFGLEGLSMTYWTMAVNGCGWLAVAALLTGRMGSIRNKLAGGDAKWLPILTAAATIGVYANMSSQRAIAGTGPLVASLGGCFGMLLMIKLSQKYKWIKEYKMGLSLIIGTVLATLVTL